MPHLRIITRYFLILWWITGTTTIPVWAGGFIQMKGKKTILKDKKKPIQTTRSQEPTTTRAMGSYLPQNQKAPEAATPAPSSGVQQMIESSLGTLQQLPAKNREHNQILKELEQDL